MQLLAITNDIKGSSIVELVTMVAAAFGWYYAYRARSISEKARVAADHASVDSMAAKVAALAAEIASASAAAATVEVKEDMKLLKEHTNDKMDKTLAAVETAATLKGRESARQEGEDKAAQLLAKQQADEIERLTQGGPEK